MKFLKLLVILCLLSIQQTALSRDLTQATRNLLSSGRIFGLGLPNYRLVAHHLTTGLHTDEALATLQEVNKSPALKEQARQLVNQQHGPDSLAEFDRMLEFGRIVSTLHSLGIFDRLRNLDEQ